MILEPYYSVCSGDDINDIKYNNNDGIKQRVITVFFFIFLCMSTIVFKLTVLWCILLQLLYAASKIGFGVARLLRVLLIPRDLPKGLRIYLKIKENHTKILKKNSTFLFTELGIFAASTDPNIFYIHFSCQLDSLRISLIDILVR